MKALFGGGGERRSQVYGPSVRILSDEIFWAMLDRERALADRAERCFALLVFDTSPRFKGDARALAIAKAIQSRLRLSDAVGWLDKNRIGALLANAGADDARKIAENICSKVGKKADWPACDVYAYPMSADSVQNDFIRRHGAPDDSAGKEARVGMASLEGVHELLAPAVPAWKRALDIAVAGSALIILAPLFLMLAAYIKLVSPGPVFYKQLRMGRACRIFSCLKFRTMHVNADTKVHVQHMTHLIECNNAPMTKLEMKEDARLIPFARIIRAAGLDELPQLINVLRGEMSVVGPRPCIPYEFEQFSTWHRRRFDTLPGLTGLWQVRGKNRTSFTQMMRYDIRYASSLSPARDAGILLQTPAAVLSQVLMIREGSEAAQ